MGTCIFLTGGARSGKSRYAAQLAGSMGGTVVYLATGTAGDAEMARRIKAHRMSRPASWKTLEEPRDLAGALKKIPRKTRTVIIDCITLWLSNLMLEGWQEQKVLRELKKVQRQIRNSPFSVVLVSNELGSGIVPENRLARQFRDTAGRVNQEMARFSDESYALIAGFPVRLK